MLKRPAALGIWLTALLAVAALSIFTAAAQTNSYSSSSPLRARQLEGMKVEDLDGQRAGTVRNLVLNMQTGNLRYLVIGYGGILGVRATLKLAPVQVVSAATAKSETLAVDATTTQWRGAPAFKYSSLAAIAQQDRARAIARYFQPATNSAGGTNVSLSKTGRDGQSDVRPAELKFASDVMGMRVVNSKQEKIGEVVDLLVSFEQRPAFAIISSGRLFQHDHQYAVPLNTMTNSGNKLIWNIDATALQNAPEFDQAAWDSRGRDGARVYQYSTPAR